MHIVSQSTVVCCSFSWHLQDWNDRHCWNPRHTWNTFDNTGWTWVLFIHRWWCCSFLMKTHMSIATSLSNALQNSPLKVYHDWTFMKYDEIWWNMVKYDEIWWNMMKYDEIWWNMMKYDEIWWHMMKYDEICMLIQVSYILYMHIYSYIHRYILQRINMNTCIWTIKHIFIQLHIHSQNYTEKI